ncbi:MAG TPA: DNA recombination protein RmuC [bacterium]|nr:DNA recombination protein RmuC [bacterium]HNS34026.1 DNA recombination protein RmuC [bacterium]HNZ73128.1 DNA recombination protein RmuC [bacterium]HOH66997.1 DNA recombination protein RmuC [bacterium]HPN81543.1 DNA recombination protein RmuC [bacterium]
MDFLLIFLLIVLIGAMAGLFLFFNRKFSELTRGRKDDQSFLMLQERIKELNQTMDNKLAESTRQIQMQFGQSAKIIQSVTEKLTKLDETNRQVVNFADQLQRLQDILKNPKQRGIFGEYQLEMLLKNAFQPNQYKMQYSLGKDSKTGQELIVDAVLFLGDKIIPIDSKFSLENYNRIMEENDSTQKEQLELSFKQDLRKRIDETAKYIRPDKGTLDFAFMFIPAEGIFYDLLVNKVGAIKVNTRDLIDYAINEKKVHIVSPTTFYVTLQSLWHGMRAFQIQEQTKEILKNVSMLDKHLNSYEEYMQKLGGHLGTTVNMYNSAYKEFKKIDKDVVRLVGGESEVEPLQLDRPQN